MTKPSVTFLSLNSLCGSCLVPGNTFLAGKFSLRAVKGWLENIYNSLKRFFWFFIIALNFWTRWSYLLLILYSIVLILQCCSTWLYISLQHIYCRLQPLTRSWDHELCDSLLLLSGETPDQVYKPSLRGREKSPIPCISSTFTSSCNISDIFTSYGSLKDHQKQNMEKIHGTFFL